MSTTSATRQIDPQMPISELVAKFPEIGELLVKKYGFHCVGCFLADFETLEEGAEVHGITGVDFTAMIKDLETHCSS